VFVFGCFFLESRLKENGPRRDPEPHVTEIEKISQEKALEKLHKKQSISSRHLYSTRLSRIYTERDI